MSGSWHLLWDGLRLVSRLAAGACMAEAARKCWKELDVPVLSAHAILPLLLIIGISRWAGTNTADVLAAYLLLMPAGLLLAGALWRYSQEPKIESERGLRGLALTFALLAITQPLVFAPPEIEWLVPFHPLSTLLPGASGIIGQALLLLIGAAAMWHYYQPSTAGAGRTRSSIAALPWFIPAGLLVVICTGWWVTSWVGSLRASRLREELQQHARVAAAGLVPTDLDALKANAADLETPEYQRVRSRLEAIQRASTGVRWFYLMRQRGDHIYFTVDSIDPGDAAHTPPGFVYNEADPEIFAAFADGRERTLGPYTDRWGTFVSAVIPITDGTTGRTLQVLGADLVADDFHREVARARLGPITLTFSGILVLLAFYVGMMRARESSTQLAASEAQYRSMFEDNTSIMLLVEPGSGKIVDANNAAADFYGIPREPLTRRRFEDLCPSGTASVLQQLADAADRKQSLPAQQRMANGTVRMVEIHAVPLSHRGQLVFFAIVHDISERLRAEQEKDRLSSQLLAAQKLESIGQLAAGIAHEINTPMQYIGDNARFLRESVEPLDHFFTAHTRLADAAATGSDPTAPLAVAEQAWQAADVDYLRSEFPKAIDQTLEGVANVSRIVRALKEFSHPGRQEKTLADVNKILDTTVTVARNEWKHVADVIFELEPELPLIPCHPGELGQTFLNLLVNAAQALGEHPKPQGCKGRITISTTATPTHIEVRLADDGPGIPEEIRHRIFDPFFTTKDVGKGTGQGLPIARSVVVDKHGGEMSFDSDIGQGTTFIVRLPRG